jgi:mannose-6-phosphate isomerase-like protein (cupin superfamily)
VTEAPKNFFYLVVLVVIASATASPQGANSTATQDSAPQTTPAKASTATAPPAANADASGVMYFPKDQVSQSFAKGAILYNGNPERNYRVHIFHRDKPGEVEVHAKDTDIFYILEGSATFVTGGTMVGGKETAPTEFRGGSTNGGVVRVISQGDVLIIPSNVPHWFREIQQPITYFVVKVR